LSRSSFSACPSRAAAIWLSIALAACTFPDVAFETDAPVDVVMASTEVDGATTDPSSGARLDEGGSHEAPNDANHGQGGSTGSSGGSSGSSGGSSGSSGGSSGSSGGSSGSSAGSSGSSGGSSGSSSGSSGGGGQDATVDGSVNCSCSSSQMYPTNVDCAAIQVTLVNLGVACKGTKGFVGSGPGCGKSGTFVTCNADLVGLVCTQTTSTVVQQCL
jgi:hypothetical protein